MLKPKLYILSFVVTMTLSSCAYLTPKQVEFAEEPVVSIGNYALFPDDIAEIIPTGTNPDDSALIADGYIRRWATDIILYNRAKNNVTNTDEINRLTDDYRRSLTIHYYQQNMVNSKVPMPSDAEAGEYYRKHQSDFILEQPVAKGLIMKVPKNSKRLNAVVKKVKRMDDKDFQKIEKYALENAIYYNVFLDRWERLDKLLQAANVETEENFAQGYYEIEDSVAITYLNLTTFQGIGKVAPEEMALEEARQKLYSVRRINYLRNLGFDLYEDALKNNEIIFYNNK